MNATSQIIAGKIVDVDQRPAALRPRLEGLSFAAVDGDASATADLAEVRAQIDWMAADREILVAAHTRALALKADAADDVKAASRAEARAAAAVAVSRLLDAARRVDQIVGELKLLSVEIAQNETEARTASQRAGGILIDARIGQRGAAGHVADIVQRHASGQVKSNSVIRSAEEFVTGGWAELIEKENADV